MKFDSGEEGAGEEATAKKGGDAATAKKGGDDRGGG